MKQGWSFELDVDRRHIVGDSALSCAIFGNVFIEQLF